MKWAASLLLLALPLAAQRAQLARKGRKPEAGDAVPATPIRKLPRRVRAVSSPTAARNPEVKHPPAAPLPEDRVRPLLKGTAAPFATPSDRTRTLPRAVSASEERTPGMPGVETTPVSNRWK